jgi:hypothetical protein
LDPPPEVDLAGGFFAFGANLTATEKSINRGVAEILRELAEGIRKIRYGSIVFVVHDGHPVEVSKTVRIRTNRPSQKE